MTLNLNINLYTGTDHAHGGIPVEVNKLQGTAVPAAVKKPSLVTDNASMVYDQQQGLAMEAVPAVPQSPIADLTSQTGAGKKDNTGLDRDSA